MVVEMLAFLNILSQLSLESILAFHEFVLCFSDSKTN